MWKHGDWMSFTFTFSLNCCFSLLDFIFYLCLLWGNISRSRWVTETSIIHFIKMLCKLRNSVLDRNRCRKNLNSVHILGLRWSRMVFWELSASFKLMENLPLWSCSLLFVFSLISDSDVNILKTKKTFWADFGWMSIFIAYDLKPSASGWWTPNED